MPTVETEFRLITWADLALRLVPAEHANRVRWRSDDELDYLDLPAPPVALLPSMYGVTFHCVDGGIYHLDGHPAHVETWRVQLIHKV